MRIIIMMIDDDDQYDVNSADRSTDRMKDVFLRIGNLPASSRLVYVKTVFTIRSHAAFNSFAWPVSMMKVLFYSK